MSGSGREGLPDVRKWSVGPRECPGVEGRVYRMSGSGVEALPDIRDMVGRPCQVPGCGREGLPDVRGWSEGHPRCP